MTSGQGSKHRDWTASRWWARWRSQSCQHHVITWRGLIPADHEYLDSVAWPCHDCEVAPVWHHDVANARTCQFFRRLFDRLPVRISTSDLHHRILRKKVYHIRDYDFGVQFSFNSHGMRTAMWSLCLLSGRTVSPRTEHIGLRKDTFMRKRNTIVLAITQRIVFNNSEIHVHATFIVPFSRPEWRLPWIGPTTTWIDHRFLPDCSWRP